MFFIKKHEKEQERGQLFCSKPIKNDYYSSMWPLFPENHEYFMKISNISGKSWIFHENIDNFDNFDGFDEDLLHFQNQVWLGRGFGSNSVFISVFFGVLGQIPCFIRYFSSKTRSMAVFNDKQWFTGQTRN